MQGLEGKQKASVLSTGFTTHPLAPSLLRIEGEL